MHIVDDHPLRPLTDAHLHGRVAAGREGTASRHVQQVDGGTGDGLEPRTGGVGRGDGPQQALGILMLGTVKDLVGGALLADGAGIHDDDLVAQLRHHAQVMGDHDDGHAQLLLQGLHQLQDLGLNGHVQCGGGLVCDQNIRFAGQGHGDHDTLTHAAGKLVGVLLHALFRLVDVDQPQHLHGAVIGLLLIAVCVQQDRLHQLAADGIGGVQGGHGILENDTDLVAADILHDLFAGAYQLLSVELDGAAHDLAGAGKDLHDGIGGDGLAGAGFTHDAQHPAALQIEGHAVDGPDLACVGKEGGTQVSYFQ